MAKNQYGSYGFSEANDGTVKFNYRQKYGVGKETETKTVHGFYSPEEQERDWKHFITNAIENEHDLTDKHVTDEHEITKEHVTEEHNQTKAHVSNEASATRTTVQAKKNELSQEIDNVGKKVDNVQSTVNSISSRVSSILGWVNSQ